MSEMPRHDLTANLHRLGGRIKSSGKQLLEARTQFEPVHCEHNELIDELVTMVSRNLDQIFMGKTETEFAGMMLGLDEEFILDEDACDGLPKPLIKLYELMTDIANSPAPIPDDTLEAIRAHIAQVPQIIRRQTLEIDLGDGADRLSEYLPPTS